MLAITSGARGDKRPDLETGSGAAVDGDRGVGATIAGRFAELRRMGSNSESMRARGVAWLAFALYVVVLVASLYPVSLSPWCLAQAHCDSIESSYICGWVAHQVLRHPAGLLDANFLYPAQHALTRIDHRLLPALIVAPIVWVSGNPLLAFNCSLAIGLLLAAMAMRRLALRLGLGLWGAWVAGAIYAFNSYAIDNGPRLQLMYFGFMALVLDQAIALLVQGQRRSAWGVAGFMLALGYCSNYLLLYAVLGLCVLVAALLCLRPRVTLAALRHLLLPSALAAALFLPVFLPYVRSARAMGYARELPTGVEVAHYLATAPGNLIYGALFSELIPRPRPLFVGFASLIAVIIGVLAVMRRVPFTTDGPLAARRWVPLALGLALAFMTLTAGRDLIAFGLRLGPGPYRLLYDWVPGFRMVRFPERLFFMVAAFLAPLVGLGVTVLRRRGLPLLAATFAVLIPLEHVSLQSARSVPAGRHIPLVYRWLATHPVHALAEVPAAGIQEKMCGALRACEMLEEYFGAYHFQRTIHGLPSFDPPETQTLHEALKEYPQTTALATLSHFGVDTIVVHYPPSDVLATYLTTLPRRRAKLARALDLQPTSFYDGTRRLEAAGLLVRVAELSKPPTRVPGGCDVVYHLAWREAQSPRDLTNR
jgi:hypothetical protein